MNIKKVSFGGEIGMEQSIDYVRLLQYSILQYKFAVGVRNRIALDEKQESICSFPEAWVYYEHGITKNGLSLTKEDEESASILLEHTSLYIMANQLDSMLEEKIGDRFNHSNSEIRSLSIITRLIRNAFAHNPFYPVWKIHRTNRNQTYEIKNIIKLDTAGLENKRLQRHDYGGPLALLAMANFGLSLMNKF